MQKKEHKLKSRLKADLISTAVLELYKYEKKKSTQKEKHSKESIFERAGKNIQAQLQLMKPQVKPVQRPVRVKIPHSLFSIEREDHSICLFCRTEDKSSIEKFLQKNPIPGIYALFLFFDFIRVYCNF